MKNAFDANVSKRKPRTRLSSILGDVQSPEPEGEGDGQVEVRAEVEPVPAMTPPPPAFAVVPPAASIEPVGVAAQPAPVARAAAPAAQTEVVFEDELEPRPRRSTPGTEAVRAGRARIAELRARLEASSTRREPAPAEPTVAAHRIRETLASMRAELRESSEERAQLLDSLDRARRELGEAQRGVDVERRAREVAENAAAERAQVAEGLLAESEALAEERDEALARIVEFRELESQQAQLLEDMQRRLDEQTAQLRSARAEALETRAALEAAEGELDAVQARAEARAAENASFRERVERLEQELAGSASAREALAEIQRLVDGLS
jgi:chromosome segregation ATPase